ncbi:hypothetical protein R1sor_027442 [Riccia sorocarpa]|uniref:Large ribosomal subunit protein uL6 N-terminal domain-containing protein n=1 Tax=Riccia sorocarpa TaxID=122646 RepID=A0ABD3GJY4_9MARC
MAPKTKKAHTSRNPPVVRGVGRHSRSKMYHKKGLWALKAKNGGSFPTTPKAVKEAPKEGRPPRFYPADDVKKPLHRNKIVNPPKLRASIAPGSVLILLAGPYKGKRVVFLKQLSSGLLLITGPFKVNGVPLRRVNQAYVIGTSTKLDVSSVDVAKFTDAYFQKEVEKKKKSESQFFQADEEKEEKSLPAEKKEDQKAVDGQLIPLIKNVPDLESYLGSRFSLKAGVKPHELVF